jgi:hypothetical protein
MTLRSLLSLLCLHTLASLGLGGKLHAQAPAAKPATPDLVWHDVTAWGVEGRAWTEMPRKRWFQRLPDAAEGKVTPPVWGLSQDSTGMLVRFKTDAKTIWADYALASDKIAAANMAATGQSGVDLYARDDRGLWRWVGVTKPATQTVKQPLLDGGAGGMREYQAYLPLRNGVESLKIGVPKDAKFEELAPRKEKPIVFYGTSITHGISASRPGMPHPAILGRRLDRPTINLGFSGNGRMDASVGEFLIKIDAAVYVIDCLPNMNATEVRQKAPALVKQLRAARPETPILLVEDRRNTNSWLLPARNQHHTDNHAALREVFEALKQEGVTGLHYLPGDPLLGDDSEAATDGSHPSDLGFMRQAAVFEPALRTILGK